MARYNTEFGEAVKTALGGRSYRRVAPGTGVSATYIGDMVQGRVPGREVVLAFAAACGLDRAETRRLMLLAGYAAPDETDEPSGERVLLEGLADLNRELGRPLAISLDEE